MHIFIINFDYKPEDSWSPEVSPEKAIHRPQSRVKKPSDLETGPLEQDHLVS